jgi:excisionase family DNA binding protein
MEKPLLRPSEISQMLNISASYVYKLADSGFLPCVRFSISEKGKRKKETLRFKEADIKNFIADSYSIT